MGYYLHAGDPRKVIWYWQWISGFLWLNGSYPEYIRCDQYALRAAQELAITDPPESQPIEAIISGELAFAYMETGELSLANQHLDRAEQLIPNLNRSRELAMIQKYRANLRFLQDDLESAKTSCLQAIQTLAEASRLGHDDQSLAQQYAQAPGFYFPEEYPTANARWRVLMAPARNTLACVYMAQGDYKSARVELLQACWDLRVLDRRAQLYWSLSPLLNVGRLYERCSNSVKAKAYYRRCVSLTEDGSEPGVRAGALYRLGRLLTTEGQKDLAQNSIQSAIKIYERMGKYESKAKCVRFLKMMKSPSSNQYTHIKADTSSPLS